MGQACLEITSFAKLSLNIFENDDLANDPVTSNIFFLFSSQLLKYLFGSK
jgi:hypothetical protein